MLSTTRLETLIKSRKSDIVDALTTWNEAYEVARTAVAIDKEVANEILANNEFPYTEEDYAEFERTENGPFVRTSSDVYLMSDDSIERFYNLHREEMAKRGLTPEKPDNDYAAELTAKHRDVKRSVIDLFLEITRTALEGEENVEYLTSSRIATSPRFSREFIDIAMPLFATATGYAPKSRAKMMADAFNTCLDTG